MEKTNVNLANALNNSNKALVENIRLSPATGLSLLSLGDIAFTLKDHPPIKQGDQRNKRHQQKKRQQ